MKIKKSEKGQAIYVVVMGLVALTAFVGLSVDGGQLYSERRRVQNTVDNAALAGALAICLENNVADAVSAVAVNNNYIHDGTNVTVTITHPYDGDHDSVSGDADDNNYVHVKINNIVPAALIHLVYEADLYAEASAVGFCDVTADFTGFPPLPFTVYGGDSSCEEPPVLVSGNTNDVFGPIHSNGDWKMSGNANSFGDVTYAGSNVQTESPNWFTSGPTDNNTVHPWPITALNIDDYKPGGLYSSDPNYHSSNKFNFSQNNYTIPPGIYYATEEISLSGNHQTGNVTLVVGGGDGKVAFSGNNHTLTPYINNVLAIAKGKECSADAIKFSGNHHIWKGIVYSPVGQIVFSGNASNTLDGCAWGAQVKFSGNAITVQNCDKYVGSNSKNINLSE